MTYCTILARDLDWGIWDRNSKKLTFGTILKNEEVRKKKKMGGHTHAYILPASIKTDSMDM